MNIQTLRYVILIENTKSINKASQLLFVSQSSISRALKDLENQIGFTLFYRTSKGVVPTPEGTMFIEKARHLIEEIDQLETLFYNSPQTGKSTLLVATQRCSPIIIAFIDYLKKYCEDFEYMNMALQEETTDNILQLVAGRVYGLGILHYTSDQEESFLNKCRSLNLEFHLLEKSRVCAQIRSCHPLAKYKELTLDMLEPYPHLTFSDESITNINYCSDVSQYNPSIHKKRIVIQDRGTLRQIIQETDGYYIGCDFNNLPYSPIGNACYIPLRDVKFTKNTLWIHRSDLALSEPELQFITILSDMYAQMHGSVKNIKKHN